MVKKSQTPAGPVPRHHGLGQVAWIVWAGCYGCLRWFGLAAVLICKLTRMDFLTIRDGDLICQRIARPTAKPAYPASFFTQITIGSNNDE